MKRGIILQYLRKVTRENDYLQNSCSHETTAFIKKRQDRNNWKLTCLIEMLQLEIEDEDETEKDREIKNLKLAWETCRKELDEAREYINKRDPQANAGSE